MKHRSNHQASLVAFVNGPIQKESQEQGLRSGSMADYLKLKVSKKETHTNVESDNLGLQKHHVVEVEQPCPKKQKTKQLKRFCLPGSLSKYRNMRKKQVRNSGGDVVIEGHSDNENECELDKEFELRSLSLYKRVRH